MKVDGNSCVCHLDDVTFLSRPIAGWVGSLAHALMSFGIVPAVALQRWLSPRALALVGVFLNCGGFFATAFVPSLWYAFLTYGLAVGIGMSFILQAGISLCLVWFPSKHSARANALVTLGTPCGRLLSSLFQEQ